VEKKAAAAEKEAALPNIFQLVTAINTNKSLDREEQLARHISHGAVG